MCCYKCRNMCHFYKTLEYCPKRTDMGNKKTEEITLLSSFNFKFEIKKNFTLALLNTCN